MTRQFELAATHRRDLVLTAEYKLYPDGTHAALQSTTSGPTAEDPAKRAAAAIHNLLGRSLAIRQVDAGSCNGCEQEIVALNNPVHDIERFGIHFVASPRHADMLLVTGPVTRNMELALRKTWAATPDPKVVVAVGACGISGGIFGTNYASMGGVDAVIPVDVYIPGCPPRPQALLHGILLALGRIRRRAGSNPHR
jgi:Ni,Fe-hydrogenase III small subunit